MGIFLRRRGEGGGGHEERQRGDPDLHGGEGYPGCHPEERSDEGSALSLDEGRARLRQGRSFASLRMTKKGCPGSEKL